jgi:hypothetical protein
MKDWYYISKKVGDMLHSRFSVVKINIPTTRSLPAIHFNSMYQPIDGTGNSIKEAIQLTQLVASLLVLLATGELCY